MQLKNKQSLISGFAIILVLAVCVASISENLGWYSNLNGYGSKEVLYESGLIRPSQIKDDKQIVLIRVLGNPGSYQWAYRYSLIYGTLPIWPFVKTIKTDKDTVNDYLRKVVINPEGMSDGATALVKAKSYHVSMSELSKLLGRGTVVISLALFSLLMGLPLALVAFLSWKRNNFQKKRAHF